MLIWIYRSLRILARHLKGQEGFLATLLPAIAGVFAAITIGDLFVQYPKFEARFWFIALLVVLLHLSAKSGSRSVESANAAG
jgi:hypothetical protein